MARFADTETTGDGGWDAISSSSVFPYDGGIIGHGQEILGTPMPSKVRDAVRGQGAGALADLLNRTSPDPAAAKYMHEPPVERFHSASLAQSQPSRLSEVIWVRFFGLKRLLPYTSALVSVMRAEGAAVHATTPRLQLHRHRGTAPSAAGARAADPQARLRPFVGPLHAPGVRRAEGVRRGGGSPPVGYQAHQSMF